MLRSMTGFGRATDDIDGFCVTAEIKSVNHRYFEFSARMPRAYQFTEEKLKAICQRSITRGKVDLSVFIEDNTDKGTLVEINRQYAGSYLKALRQFSKEYRIKNDLRLSNLIGNGDLFKITANKTNDEIIERAILTVTEKAIKSFIEMRETEGGRLKEDILSRAESILEKVEFIERQAPETVRQYQERIRQKIRELLGSSDIDEQRIITEAAIFADKIAVDEETVRLRSHISQLRNLLESSEASGKKLDFLVQEMNREANTIGSKSQNVKIAHTVVDIKADIEKIREQIQNIE